MMVSSVFVFYNSEQRRLWNLLPAQLKDRWNGFNDENSLQRWQVLRKTQAQNLGSHTNHEELSEISETPWVQRIYTDDLRMKRIAAKFGPRVLTNNQKGIKLKHVVLRKYSLKLIHISYRSSLLVMSHGAMVKIKKQSNGQANERRYCPLVHSMFVPSDNPLNKLFI